MTKFPYGCDIKDYTKKEYEADMGAKLKYLGLYKAVEEILDNIVEENRDFSYAHFSLITEWCCDILKLIELADRGDNNE